MHRRRRDGRQDRGRHAEPEGLGDSQAEGLVDARHDVRDERLDDRTDCGRHPGQDGRAQVADAGQLVEVELAAGARLAEAGDDLGRDARLASCGPAVCSWNVVAKIVPTMASATVPPIWRKNVRFEVATPSWWNGTAFWTMIVKTENVGPTPRPARNIQNQTIGSGVSAVSWVISRPAKPMTTIAPTTSHLYRPVRDTTSPETRSS